VPAVVESTRARALPSVAICVAQTLYLHGGAELLVATLAHELQERGFAVEIVKIPFTWDKADLLRNALLWRFVRVTADRAITTNFPSYFLRHRHKTVWLLHQHRMLYDLRGTEFSDFGDAPADEATHQIVREADTKFISEARGIFTISRNVSDRLQRFNGVASEPVYHPPPLHRSIGFERYGNFVLLPTRLEPHKRPALLVEAMRHTRSGIRAVIAGRGPLQQELRGRIDAYGLRDRVALMGYVDEATLVELYAECAMVFYTPFDEDYGYVPLEAFYANKPVVTTADAGGVLEFVIDEETGLVSDPDPVALAARIDRLAESEGLSARLGNAGNARVSALSWDTVVDRLVEPL
jgi:glycosyltransferase involved in cell wall biosynthesis